MRFGFDFLPEDVSEGGGNTPTAVERTYVDKVTASDGVTYDIQDTVALERVNGYIINYTLNSDHSIAAVNSDANTQVVNKIVELINAGDRPNVYARLYSGSYFTIPCTVRHNRSTPVSNFTLEFILSRGGDTLTGYNDTYAYEDLISVSSSTVSHTIKKTDLRATRVNSNADGNGFLYYWRLPLVYKRYEYFNALHYFGPMDEGNDYYQSGPFVIAACSDNTPADGSTFTASLSDFTTITNKYPELPPMMYISFAKQTQAGGTAIGDAYWLPIGKTIYETSQTGFATDAELKGFTGVFTDKSGNMWKVTYDIDTSTGTINAVGGGSVSKYDIDLTVNVVGSTSTPTFTKINGYTTESDIIAQLHNLYLDLQAGKHPVITFNYFTNRESNAIATLCPVSASAVNEHHICFVWEWSVPTTSTADRIPTTRYVNQLLTAHDGTSSNRYTYRTYTLT